MRIKSRDKKEINLIGYGTNNQLHINERGD